jgi:hypothetical protein
MREIRPNEQKLLGCAKQGIWCDFLENRDSEDAVITIRGEFLREILLTAPTPGERILALRLKGAVIEGVIDLCDSSNIDGGNLPPILFEQCVLKGDVRKPDAAVLTARHAHLSRLSLTRCKFGRIDISNAIIDGDLAIDEVRPLSQFRPCQVIARRVCIRGMVNARQAKLKIPRNRKIPYFDIDDYAFDFSGADINGPVYLCPDFFADGGVSFQEATVEGSIWAIEAKLLAGANTAFRGDSLKCTGTVSLQSSDVVGDIVFLAATAG